MWTKKSLQIILFAVIISFLLNIFFGRYLTAKVSTMPLLNRWHLLSPQAPIVINTREEVRMGSNSGDIPSAVNNVKSKLSLLAINSLGDLKFTGSAVNLSSDGYFLTTQSALGNYKIQNFVVILNDGSQAKVDKVIADPASSLVIFHANLNNVPVANFGSSADLLPGDVVIFTTNSILPDSPIAIQSSVTKAQNNIFEVAFNADAPTRVFSAPTDSSLIFGNSIINIKGEVVGIWDGRNLISSDVIKMLVDNFFGSGNKITRPNFGFHYWMIPPTLASILDLHQGAQIKRLTQQDSAVTPGGPAQKAGLMENDVITAINGNQVSGSLPLETGLENFKPGDNLQLQVQRGQAILNLSLVVGTLKPSNF